MRNRNRVVTAAIVAVAVVVPTLAMTSGVASAKTVKFKSTLNATQKGTVTGGKFTGTFGKGSCKGKALGGPKNTTTCVWKFKGGSFKVTAGGGLVGGTKAAGTWTLTKGTGKFKKAKLVGKGKFTGDIGTLVFVYTGKISY